MAGFTNAEKFANIHLPYGVADVVATAIDESTADATAGKAQIVALVALTDNSGGTPSNTIVDVPATYTEATLANQLASLAAKINAIIAALKA